MKTELKSGSQEDRSRQLWGSRQQGGMEGLFRAVMPSVASLLPGLVLGPLSVLQESRAAGLSQDTCWPLVPLEHLWRGKREFSKREPGGGGRGTDASKETG